MAKAKSKTKPRRKYDAAGSTLNHTTLAAAKAGKRVKQEGPVEFLRSMMRRSNGASIAEMREAIAKRFHDKKDRSGMVSSCAYFFSDERVEGKDGKPSRFFITGKGRK